jgi:glycosyltransferase involved in cell wall biosynthesis
MRIAIVTDAWFPQTSGVVTALSNISKGLEARGHEVKVIHPGLFKTVPCPTYPQIRLSCLPYRKLRRVMKDFKPEAIHIPVEGPLGLAGRNYCVKHDLPYTTSFMTKFPEYINIRSGIPISWSHKVLKWFHGKAERVTVSTPSLERELTALGYDNLVYWGRGVDTELFRPRDKSALDEHDVSRPVLLYMGRVAPEKNIEKFLALEHPGTKVVIGDGPSLDQYIKNNPEALFLGRKTGEDLARHVEAGDVFVFPSLTDTFGIVLIEAMACGLPVAAYPVMGPVDVVKHGETGWLDEDLEVAVAKALTMDPAACRSHALNYTWEKSVDQFEGMLEKVGEGAKY